MPFVMQPGGQPRAHTQGRGGRRPVPATALLICSGLLRSNDRQGAIERGSSERGYLWSSFHPVHRRAIPINSRLSDFMYGARAPRAGSLPHAGEYYRFHIRKEVTESGKAHHELLN